MWILGLFQSMRVPLTLVWDHYGNKKDSKTFIRAKEYTFQKNYPWE